jgi:hypothetical protein
VSVSPSLTGQDASASVDHTSCDAPSLFDLPDFFGSSWKENTELSWQTEVSKRRAFTSGAMFGTTPPSMMITCCNSLLNLRDVENVKEKKLDFTSKDALVIVPNSQLQMARDNPFLLVVPCRIARELKNLSDQIL